MPAIVRHLRRLAGIPNSSRQANTTPPLAYRARLPYAADHAGSACALKYISEIVAYAV